MDDRRMIQDMQQLLNQQLSHEAEIQLDQRCDALEQMAALLHPYPIPYVRKVVILGCYYLLHHAILRHRELQECEADHPDESLAKTILDGDYLLGVYFQMANLMDETRLIAHLTSAYKRIQIKLIHGTSIEDALALLPQEIIDFLEEESSKSGGDTDEAA